MKVRREHDPHELIDVTLTQLKAPSSGLRGRRELPCVATDTMQNTRYAFARTDDIAHIELR